MSAQTWAGIVAAPGTLTAPPTLESDRAQARLRAHRLVQQVQLREAGDELAAQLRVAEARGWSEVVRVLLYADVVRAWVRNAADRDETIAALYERATRDHDDVLTASALASRAEHRYRSSSAAVNEQGNRDLARAAALLEVATGGGLERGTAAIDCGSAYGQRELWELELEMYALAAEALADCEEPLLAPALVYNQAAVDVHYACSLREIGDTDELHRLHQRVTADGGLNAWAQLMPDSPFAVDVRVNAHLLARLLSVDTREGSTTLGAEVSQAGGPYERPLHGLLRLADALHAADSSNWVVAAEQATAALRLADHTCSPIMGMALRRGAQAQAAIGAAGAQEALAYCDWSARRRWETRLQLLAAARAGLEAEQLRVERDEHARQAQVDELTGLANRRAYTLHTERLQLHRGDSSLAAVLVDVDGFKGVNDTFGHDIGDAVLVRVANVLARGTRPDDIVARLGGDEFVVLLEGIEADSAHRRAADMLDHLAGTEWTNLAPNLRVRMSIGIAVGNCRTPQDLLTCADKALYETKRRGGNGITIHPA